MTSRTSLSRRDGRGAGQRRKRREAVSIRETGCGGPAAACREGLTRRWPGGPEPPARHSKTRVRRAASGRWEGHGHRGRIGRASCPPRGGLRPHESAGGLARRETSVRGGEGGAERLSTSGLALARPFRRRPRTARALLPTPPPDRPRGHADPDRLTPRRPPRSDRPPGPHSETLGAQFEKRARLGR